MLEVFEGVVGVVLSDLSEGEFVLFVVFVAGEEGERGGEEGLVDYFAGAQETREGFDVEFGHWDVEGRDLSLIIIVVIMKLWKSIIKLISCC